MTLLLQAVVVTACVIVLASVVLLVKRGSLLLRYALSWLVLAMIVLMCGIFPQPVFALATLLGFSASSNFIFFIGMVFSLLVSLMLSSIASRQTVSIKNLTQRVAILENELEKMNK